MLKISNNSFRTSQKLFVPIQDQRRSFWEYVNKMFNTPDPKRIQEIGANRACAEWVLRNGGKVVWDTGKTQSDYNLLPADDQIDQPVHKIVEIDATDSGISHYGFPHLVGCDMIKKIILSNASYIDDRALKGLSNAKESLKHVQVSKCVQVTDEGLKELKVLTKLEKLVIFNLTSVNDLEGCSQFLSNHLQNCEIKGAADEVNAKAQ